jgi:hypothetical protein
MKITPNVVLASTIGVVGLSTSLLPFVRGYGTVLFQIVVLGAWRIVAGLTSGEFADHHHGPVWVTALLLNMVAFSVPAIAAWLFLRRRVPVLCSLVVSCWCLFYLASLFILFRATDGP